MLGHRTNQQVVPAVRYKNQLDSIPQEYRELLLDIWSIDSSSELVNAAVAKWAFSRTDVTSLSLTHDENESWMKLLAKTALGPEVGGEYPYHATGICTWGTEKGDEKNFAALKKFLQQTPFINISATSNFSDGSLSPKDAGKSVERIGSWMQGYEGQIEVDNVINYQAWIAGDEALVKETLIAEREAASKYGLVMKTIQKATAHVVSTRQSFFDSLYNSTTMCLEVGVDCVKTSTGKAAAKPYNYDVSQDISNPEVVLPMLVALRDFNKVSGTNRFAKLSGGQINAVDAARIKYMVEAVLGKEALDKVVIGASYMFPRNMMQFIFNKEAEKNSGVTRKDFGPQGLDALELPPHLKGLTF